MYSSSAKDDEIEDYDDTYGDNRSLIELIGTFIRRATDDEKYAWKMVQVLAKKLGVESELREKPLDSDEWFGIVFKGNGTKKKSCNRNGVSKQKVIT